MPHAALWVVQQKSDRWCSVAWCFNAARGFVGGAALEFNLTYGRIFVSMPHAALWVVQHYDQVRRHAPPLVSMPHAALWVVQPRKHVSQ